VNSLQTHHESGRATPQPSISCGVELYVAASGNHFMVEIAESFMEGFRVLGLAAEVRLDEVPGPAVPGAAIPIIVAPHEFFPLFLRQKFNRSQIARMVQDWFLVNTEQPGSPWFELAYVWARSARGVFDINAQGAAILQKRGLAARYTPLGYTPSLESVSDTAGRDRPIDVLFLGHVSHKRARFFARHAALFHKYNCHFILPDVARPRLSTDPNVFAGSRRNQLVRNSKIILNVHSADRTYFEWHRVMCAAANLCLVVSERSDQSEPFRNGEHLIFGDLDELPRLCEHYLNNESERQIIVGRAYQLLRERLSIADSCRTMLQEATAPRQSPESFLNRARRVSRNLKYDTYRRVASTVRGARALAAQAITSSPRAMNLYCKLLAPEEVVKVEPLAIYEQRRRAIIGRLASRPKAGGNGAEVPSEVNAAYPSCPSPAVSVIVTLYNYAAYIEECLQSVAASVCDDLPGGIEAIVVDDASTDSSIQRVQDFADQSNLPIRLVRKPTNTGLADARNVGVSFARAPYVFILDADNYIYPHTLTKLYRALKSSGQAGAYGIIAQFKSANRDGAGLLSHSGWDPQRLLLEPYVDAMALLDREKLLAVGGYSTDLIRYGWFGWEDYDLWLKMIQAGHDCQFVPEIVAAYRVHKSSMINVTGYYLPNLMAHFTTKFAGLLGVKYASYRFGGLASIIPATAQRMGDDGVIAPDAPQGCPRS
jgi:glycosyltransferase involved in cell wall biosynthesis